MDMRKMLPFVRGCVPALCLSLAVLGACGGGDDEDGPDTADAGRIDAGHSTGDAGSGEDAGGEEGKWPNIDTKDYEAFYDFIPEGAFAIRTLNGESARFVAKSADGSITVAELSAKKPDDEHWKQANSWYIWKGHEYWSLHHDIIGTDENRQDRFFLDYLTDEAGDAAKTPRMVNVKTGYEWYSTTVTIDDVNPLLFHYNYLNFPSDDAEYAGDEEIMGVTTHKYAASNSSATAEWFVLDNGFCVKKNFRWAWSDDEGWDGTESFEPVILELGSRDYEEVLQKYGVFYDQVDPSKTPPVSEMTVQTNADTSGQWIAPSRFQPWTQGSIDFAVNFRAMNWDDYPIYKIFVKMKPGTNLPDETEAYKAQLLTIPDMMQEEDSGCLNFGGYDLGCTWEYSNQGEQCGGFYYFYRITTTGTGISGTDTPSTPDVIFSEMTRCVEV